MLRPISARLPSRDLTGLEIREENRMGVKVIIPTPLRAYAGKRDSTEVKAGTVGEALGRLTTEFGDLRKHLFTEDGKLRSFVNVYVNDEDIRYLAKENTPTKDGDTISIVPSIAGGCRTLFCHFCTRRKRQKR